ncbi:hypothetical protein [Nereida sp. MMG025]|uniref:hypothetical protein n=1 Tax=Nereida sp. MMG025 TaxID=2909981 RepID=UPI001F31E52D|nr:hypothetical protein [Nereida sp. MMG025]MCF6444466.1 hypothetical protein [Nereida sp. MMG025]
MDRDRLAELYVQLGDNGAEGVVCRALEEISARINRMEAHFRANEHEALAKTARSLIAIAEQVGMHKLSRVAADFGETYARRDEAAMGATFARLLRVGEASLDSIWDSAEVPV